MRLCDWRYSARTVSGAENVAPDFFKVDTPGDAYASLSVEGRHARIESVSNAQRQRIAAQSPEEGDTRLQQLRTAREQRIETESMEERQTRLQQLRSAQQQRIAAEPRRRERPVFSS